MLRVALPRSLLRPQSRLYNIRWNTTASPEKKSSNWPFLLLVGGCTGLGGYIYLDKYSMQKTSPLDPEKWINFKLKKVVPYNHNTSEFVFELPDNQASLLPVASCIVIKSADPEALKDAKGGPIVRPYTPISPSDKQGELTFLIKRYDTGNASKYIHGLSEGDSLAIKGPIPKFKYKLNEFDEVGLIGGGSGITPLYQILAHALSSPANTTKFTLLYANIAEADILLRERFDELKKKHPTKFDVVYALDKPPKDWNGAKGYITPDLIKEHLAPPTLGNKVKIFVCGPPPQVAAIAGKKDGMKQGELSGALKDLGYALDQVFKF